MSYYLGIDFGTSGARAIAINSQKAICAQARQPFTAASPMAQSWQDTLFALIQTIPADIRHKICAIAINGTSSTVLLCDALGTAIAEPILYNDARGVALLPHLEAFFAQPQHAHAPCQANVLSATSSLVKLLWWQQQPYFSQAHYLMHQADWLAFLLHGKPGISDYHNCLKLGYDVARLEYPSWMADLGVLPLLPTVVSPGTQIALVKTAIATQLGLPATCQVCAGTTDSIAAFLASGANTPGTAVTSLGSTLVLKLLSTAPVENSAAGIYSHRLGELWLVGGASNTGGAVLKAFFSDAELEHLSQQIDPTVSSNLDYYPLLQPGDRFPINDPNLPPRLQPRPPDPVQFLHGLLESMARIEADGYYRLQDLGATPLSTVYSAGGGAQNPTWTAIRQRYLPVPVLKATHTEAAYGTANLVLPPNAI
jgi:sugar (pentulose or hexulose) kinase